MFSHLFGISDIRCRASDCESRGAVVSFSLVFGFVLFLLFADILGRGV